MLRKLIFGFLFFFNIALFGQEISTIPLPFDTLKLSPKPNYSEMKSWAAHPNQSDYADKLPENKLNLKDNQSTAEVDVFFIYPTVFISEDYKNGYWNASIADESLNEKIGKGTIMNQATIFNGSCRVFSPFYRQAILAAYFTKDKESAKNAFQLAYEDVKNAFDYYLKNENKGRPIIIAGHSQGTDHAERLLKEYFDGQPLQSQLVAAYLVGMPIKTNEFKCIKPMYNETEFGGFVSWGTYQDEFYPPNYAVRYDSAMVVNPMTWTNDENWQPRNKNLGLVSYNYKLVPNALEARCNEHILWIKTPFVLGRSFVHKNNWHVADYNLFWMNTRENVALRIKQFLLKNKYDNK